MKSLLLIALVSTCFICSSSAQEMSGEPGYRFGLGVRLSNSTPTLNNSITGKYFVTNQNAVEGILSFGSRFGVGALLEIHKPTNIEGLRWFYGGGAYVGFENSKTYLGPTGIIGIDYKFANVPINLSVDYKPELDFLPEINFVPDAFAFSVRFALK
ncbi:MAG: hypothetical protein JNK79_00955 [Chitinophagaceae bacterium]|nr:hypothetical protein [Chitinophagaceae bacterium]